MPARLEQDAVQRRFRTQTPSDCMVSATSGVKVVDISTGMDRSRQGTLEKTARRPSEPSEGAPRDRSHQCHSGRWSAMNVPMWAWAAFRRSHRRHVAHRPARPPRRARHRLQGSGLVERTLGRFVSRVRGGRHPDLGGELGRRIHHGLAVGEEPLRRQPLRVRPDLRLLQGAP